MFQLEADDAFGRHNPRLVERIARSALPAGMELKVNSLIGKYESIGAEMVPLSSWAEWTGDFLFRFCVQFSAAG